MCALIKLQNMDILNTWPVFTYYSEFQSSWQYLLVFKPILILPSLSITLSISLLPTMCVCSAVRHSACWLAGSKSWWRPINLCAPSLTQQSHVIKSIVPIHKPNHFCSLCPLFRARYLPGGITEKGSLQRGHAVPITPNYNVHFS